MNPWNPFLSPPRFSAEFRITPVFQDLQSGEFELPEQGLAFDFVKPLGFVEQTVFVEIYGAPTSEQVFGQNVLRLVPENLAGYEG